MLAFYQKLMYTPYLTQSRSDNIKEQEVFNKEPGRDIHVADQTFFGLTFKLQGCIRTHCLLFFAVGNHIVISVLRLNLSLLLQ